MTNPYLELAWAALANRSKEPAQPENTEFLPTYERYELHEPMLQPCLNKPHVSSELNEGTISDAWMQLQKLVERVGKREVFFHCHRHQWDTAEHSRRVLRLIEDHTELDRLLETTGARIEDHGWTAAHDGRWHRLGEAPVAVRYSEAEQLMQATLPVGRDLQLQYDADENLCATLVTLEADLGSAACDTDLHRLHQLAEEYLAICARHDAARNVSDPGKGNLR